MCKQTETRLGPCRIATAVTKRKAFRVRGLGCRVWGVGSRVKGLGCRVQGDIRKNQMEQNE